MIPFHYFNNIFFLRTESLSLVKLDYAPAQNAEVLQAIGVMCPNLKEVHFHDHLPVSERCENDIRVKRIESESSDDRLRQVESSLLGWPQASIFDL